MTIACFPDIHAKLPALEAVLPDMDIQKPAGQTVFRHAINIGSVGEPKDGDPRALYMTSLEKMSSVQKNTGGVGIVFFIIVHLR